MCNQERKSLKLQLLKCYYVTKSSIHVNYEGIECVLSIDTNIVELMSVTLKEKPTIHFRC